MASISNKKEILLQNFIKKENITNEILMNFKIQDCGDYDKKFLNWIDYNLSWKNTIEGYKYWYEMHLKFIVYVIQHNRKMNIIPNNVCVSVLRHALDMSSGLYRDFEYYEFAKKYFIFLDSKYFNV